MCSVIVFYTIEFGYFCCFQLLAIILKCCIKTPCIYLFLKKKFTISSIYGLLVPTINILKFNHKGNFVL